MAILWSKKIQDRLYEIRTAGKTLRLYTNGILHSQYNPNHLMTGSVWDFLSIGGFWVPKGQLKRVLVLGVGGGAVLHQIRRLFDPDEIIGVELSTTHIELGKRFFDLDSEPFRLIEDNAIAWLNSYEGPPFDMIIDDMFDERDGEPFRVAKPDTKWLSLLTSNLTSHGVLVMNFALKEVFHELKQQKLEAMGIQSAYRFTTDNCDNIVGVLARNVMSSGDLRDKLREWKELDTRRKSCRLKYNIRPMFNSSEIGL